MKRIVYQCVHCGQDTSKFYEWNYETPQTVKCENCGLDSSRVYGLAGKSHVAGWPMESVANGVLPHQVGEAISLDKSLGVPTDYNRSSGNPIFRDRAHRRDWLRAHRRVDLDGGYGD